MNKRIKELRKILRLSQKEFAETLKITQAGFSKIEVGGSVLTDKNISIICQTFNVNENWLRNGIEPIFNENENVDDALETVFKQYNLSPFMQDIVIRYLELPKHLQEAFEEFVKTISKKVEENKIEIIANEEDSEKFFDERNSNIKKAD